MKIIYFKEGFNVKKWKKVTILVGMVALLVVTGYLNYKIGNKNSVVTTSGNTSTIVSTANFFATYRVDRTETRSKEIEVLETIIASNTSTTEAKASATAKKMDLVAVMEKELVIEGLVKAKGFEDAVVTMSTENVNVIVKGSSLSSDEASKILSVVVKEIGCPASNVKIMSIE